MERRDWIKDEVEALALLFCSIKSPEQTSRLNSM